MTLDRIAPGVPVADVTLRLASGLRSAGLSSGYLAYRDALYRYRLGDRVVPRRFPKCLPRVANPGHRLEAYATLACRRALPFGPTNLAKQVRFSSIDSLLRKVNGATIGFQPVLGSSTAFPRRELFKIILSRSQPVATLG